MRRRASVGAIEIAYDELGAGDRPLVLIHGFTGSRDDWREVLPRLAAHGRVLAPDLRGHGDSSKPDDLSGYTPAQMTADVVGFLDAAGAPRCDLVGHSILGGTIALEIALAAPARVASLLLMDTAAESVWGDVRPQYEAAARIARDSGMAALHEIARAATERALSPVMARTNARMGPEAYWSRIRAKLHAMDPRGFAALFDAIDRHPSVAKHLGAIACPTTVMVGAEDAQYRAPCEALAAGIPGARLVVVPGAEHVPQLENEAAWLEAVGQHIRWARSAR